ncbi:hypothetical protein CBM2589_B10047 [Cupriavidus taiwanensis]|uniref:Uncharacterized protein n=1 Tax=Cupriavidus taiwanensis TaxID=164546 RepID=A0A375B7W3_9BURK|nr:hypothetical protein CBM2589_B10047 [Cupriavidus taiwanensis]
MRRFTVPEPERREASWLAPFCFQARIARACPSSDKRLQSIGVLIDLPLERRNQSVEADAIGHIAGLQIQQGQDGLETGADAQQVVADFEDVVLEGDGFAGLRWGGFGAAAELGAVNFGQVFG